MESEAIKDLGIGGTRNFMAVGKKGVSGSLLR
jgi:hypothetical protein